MNFIFIRQSTTNALTRKMDHFEKLKECTDKNLIPNAISEVLHDFYISYGEATEENGYTAEQIQPILNHFLDLVLIQLKNPYSFELFHERLLDPINYYEFGLDILRPLIDFPKSKVLGLENLQSIEKALARKENVILFSNHQTEPDPQAISLLLEDKFPKIAEEMIFMAGHRVISDPLAVPFSLGRNLLCIFSKRHIETEPDKKQEKMSHNQRTMKKMAQLLDEGGKCIYVAPSGGRDRLNDTGEITVAPFDPQSIELFRLIGKQSTHPTHFYPLALYTYYLLPPPSSIEKNLGERRRTHCTPIHLSFGPEIDMEKCVDSTTLDKKMHRKERADAIWKIVNDSYLSIRN